MRVKVITVGVLEHCLPGGEDVIEAEDITVRGLLDNLARKHGSSAAGELLGPDGLREGLCLLVNGRNALSLSEGFQTPLQDGDEVVITVLVTGG